MSTTLRIEIISQILRVLTSELLQQKFKEIHITILCDVDNPICGPEGAAAVFAPQKGASPEQIIMLDNQLCLWSDLLKQHTGKDVTRLKHGGAAGGITAAMHALLNAQLISGFRILPDLSPISTTIFLQAGIVITGEGKLISSPFMAKFREQLQPYVLQQNVPVYAVVGLAEKQVLARFDKVFTMSQYARSIQDSIKMPRTT